LQPDGYLEKFMIKQLVRLTLLVTLLVLTGCKSVLFAADTLPWVGNEPILFKDDFSAAKGGWITHEDRVSFAGYQDGGFRLWMDVPNYQFWSVPGLNFKDARVFVQAGKRRGPDDNLFGILCRYQNTLNYYALVIGSDGYYGIIRVEEGQQTLVDQTHMDFSEDINRGVAINEIQAICQSDQLALFVNGVKLIQVQDKTFSHGDVGLIVGNFSQPGVDILFDNFIVLRP